jgi:hypothetical protein
VVEYYTSRIRDFSYPNDLVWVLNYGSTVGNLVTLPSFQNMGVKLNKDASRNQMETYSNISSVMSLKSVSSLGIKHRKCRFLILMDCGIFWKIYSATISSEISSLNYNFRGYLLLQNNHELSKICRFKVN